MRFLALILVAVMIVPAVAHDPDPNSIEGKRVAMFKKSGAGIKQVFDKHLPDGDLEAVATFAHEMADWGTQMIEFFPEGSKSIGAKDNIWEAWEDFEVKADKFSEAAAELAVAAASGDLAAATDAAKALGGTCKSCHESYRNKH